MAMRSRVLRLLAAALAPAGAAVWLACGSRSDGGKVDDPPDAEEEYVPRRPRDAANDTGDAGDAADVMTLCDPTTPFQAVTALPGAVNTASDDAFPTLTDDELTLYFQRTPSDGGSATFFVAQRPKASDAFGAPAALTELDDGRVNSGPAITAAGDALFFASSSDIYTASRGPSGRFEKATRIAQLSAIGSESAPAAFARGEELWFSLAVDGGGGPHLRRSARLPGGFTAPERIPELESTGSESGVASTRDGLTVYFGSSRDGGLGNGDIWLARRTSRSAPFTSIGPVPSVSSAADDAPGWLSADGCRLYFTSSRLGSYDIFVASRP
jgi:hypothetical protein